MNLPSHDPPHDPRRGREEWDIPSEEDTHQEPPLAVLLGNWLSKLLGLTGLAVLLAAGFVAWQNARLLERFSGQATAVVDLEQAQAVREPAAQRSGSGFPTEYLYEVEDAEYRLTQVTGRELVHEIALRYDPTDPGSYYLGHIIPPVWCLFSGGLVGVFLMLASWQFQRPHKN